jgi:hypothetical protein
VGGDRIAAPVNCLMSDSSICALPVIPGARANIVPWLAAGVSIGDKGYKFGDGRLLDFTLRSKGPVLIPDI